MGFFLKLRTTSRLNSLLKPSDLQKVIHAFLHLEMSDVNALYIGVSQSFPTYTISPITDYQKGQYSSLALVPWV